MLHHFRINLLLSKPIILIILYRTSIFQQFHHCIVCDSNYGFWYLQKFLKGHVWQSNNACDYWCRIQGNTTNTTMLERFQSPIEISQKEAKSLFLAYTYTTAHSWLCTGTSSINFLPVISVWFEPTAKQ
jgi:hypothetical protein